MKTYYVLGLFAVLVLIAACNTQTTDKLAGFETNEVVDENYTNVTNTTGNVTINVTGNWTGNYTNTTGNQTINYTGNVTVNNTNTTGNWTGNYTAEKADRTE